MSNAYQIQNKSKYFPLLCRVSTQDIKPHFSGDPSSPRVTCIGHVKRSNKVTGFPTPKSSTTPTTRRSAHNHHQRTPLKTITPTTPGLPRGSILLSHHSPLRPKTTHKKKFNLNPPNTSPRTPKTRPMVLNSNYSATKTALEKSSAEKSNVNYFKLKRLLFPEKIIEFKTVTRNSSLRREINKAEFNDESRRKYDVELDPPLPVVKIVKEEVNLWKRRCSQSGNIELKSLKIQQIHVGNHNHYQLPTTV